MNEVEVTDEVTADVEPHLPSEIEQMYREVIRAECKMVGEGFRDKNPDLRFVRGARWYCGELIRKLGHGDVVDEIFREEIDAHSRKIRGRGFFGNIRAGVFDQTMTRIIMPGNRMEASVDPF
jgi:hypothetical protein